MSSPRRYAGSECCDTGWPRADPLPQVSVILQYFRMPTNIPFLQQWAACPRVELLVNVDSRTQADVAAWLNDTVAEHVIFSRNIHEIRAYNRLARMARAPLLAFVQDDDAPPADCGYIERLRHMLEDDQDLAIVGSNVYTNTPGAIVKVHSSWEIGGAAQRQPHVRAGVGGPGTGRRGSMPRWHGRNFSACYAACVDIGPMFVRRDAFMRLGGFDERLSLPGRSGIYLDFELSLRAWQNNYTVAATAVKPSKEPPGFTHAPPARLHFRAQATGKKMERPTSEKLVNGLLEMVDDATGDLVNSATSETPRFRADRTAGRPSEVTDYVHRVGAAYLPAFDRISRRVYDLNHRLAAGLQWPDASRRRGGNRTAR